MGEWTDHAWHASASPMHPTPNGAVSSTSIASIEAALSEPPSMSIASCGVGTSAAPPQPPHTLARAWSPTGKPPEAPSGPAAAEQRARAAPSAPCRSQRKPPRSLGLGAQPKPLPGQAKPRPASRHAAATRSSSAVVAPVSTGQPLRAAASAPGPRRRSRRTRSPGHGRPPANHPKLRRVQLRPSKQLAPPQAPPVEGNARCCRDGSQTAALPGPRRPAKAAPRPGQAPAGVAPCRRSTQQQRRSRACEHRPASASCSVGTRAAPPQPPHTLARAWSPAGESPEAPSGPAAAEQRARAAAAHSAAAAHQGSAPKPPPSRAPAPRRSRRQLGQPQASVLSRRRRPSTAADVSSACRHRPAGSSCGAGMRAASPQSEKRRQACRAVGEPPEPPSGPPAAEQRARAAKAPLPQAARQCRGGACSRRRPPGLRLRAEATAS